MGVSRNMETKQVRKNVEPGEKGRNTVQIERKDQGFYREALACKGVVGKFR